MPKLNYQLDWREKLTIAAIICLSFTGISVAKIGKALLTPYHLMMGVLIVVGLFYAHKINKEIILSLLILLLYMLGVNIFNIQTVKLTSVLYTVIFCIEMMILYNFMKASTTPVLKRALELVIILYFINVMIGFCFSLVGFHVPAIEQIIRIYHMQSGETRPMGWSTEPSYAAFIMAMAYLAYNHLNDHELNKNVAKLTFAFILASVLMKTAFGIIYIGVCMFDWAIHLYPKFVRSIRLMYPFFGIIIVVGGSYLLSNSDLEALKRLDTVGTILFDPFDDNQKKMAKLQEKDASAFGRIGPTFMLIAESENLKFNVYTGAGAGAAGTFLLEMLSGVLIDDGDAESLDVGLIPAFVIDYGFIGFILLWIFFLIFTMYNLPISFWLCMILIMFNANINTQILWFAITCCLAVSMNRANKHPP
ncbi:MAG: hypothetical protein ACI87N_002297 [Flavobacteriales bacterium]